MSIFFCCGPGTHFCTSDFYCVVTQFVENLKRVGVHTMEKALAFDALSQLESPSYDIAAVARLRSKEPL